MKEIKKWLKFRKTRIPLYVGQTVEDALKNNVKFKLHRGKKINIKIDEITNCLIDNSTGKEVITIIEPIKITKKLQNKLYKTNWFFDWYKDKGKEIYSLKLENSDVIEGLISLDIKDGYVEVNKVELNPRNRGHNGKYQGVGSHLFAIACKRSIEEGLEGFVCFDSKTRLKEYYKQKLNADIISSQRMYINDLNGKILVEKYFKGGTKFVKFEDRKN